jgi:NADH:ubiquinone oxidoreductase subunit F (NADH-binding)
MIVHRVLDPTPVRTLAAYERSGGGAGLRAARAVEPAAVVDAVGASGLRGRGGAGFPTGVKWRTVADLRSGSAPGMVVVNAAEGEPGSFKDRAILRTNPFRVLEGALIAAHAVRADTVVVGIKASFTQEVAGLRGAIAELRDAGWLGGVDVVVVEGPEAYLFGEETAMLEVIDGRPPFPRLAPPFRHGIEAGIETPEAAGTVMTAPRDGRSPPPTLVDNTETLANVPAIVSEGPDWFRSVGTERSPGTVVCTVSGSTRRHGVEEVALGTPLGEVIETIGLRSTHAPVAVLSGVANPILPAALLDTPMTYEDLEAAGSGLGASGFIVFDDRVDLAAVAHGVARFLAVESCGQCTPCKQDGLAIATHLDRIRRSDADETDLDGVADHVATVADGARCYLAHQTQRVVDGVLRLMPEVLAAHLVGAAPAAPYLIAPIVDIEQDRAVLDETHPRKQPDWTYDDVDSGRSPADLADREVSAD